MHLNPSKMTRPQRRVLFAFLFATAWLLLVLPLWLPRGNTWLATGAAIGTFRQSYGGFEYLVVEEQQVSPARKPAGPGYSRTFHWRGWRLAATLALTLVNTAVFIVGYHWWTNRYRLAGACDECGYNLTGLTSGRCPECGAAVR